jgi:hypothetical protein
METWPSLICKSDMETCPWLTGKSNMETWPWVTGTVTVTWKPGPDSREIRAWKPVPKLSISPGSFRGSFLGTWLSIYSKSLLVTCTCFRGNSLQRPDSVSQVTLCSEHVPISWELGSVSKVSLPRVPGQWPCLTESGTPVLLYTRKKPQVKNLLVLVGTCWTSGYITGRRHRKLKIILMSFVCLWLRFLKNRLCRYLQ